MTKDGQLKQDEILIRGLVRLPSDLDGEFGRLHQDKGDFVRKANYRKTGKPENGISVFRRSNYPTNQEFYARVNIRLPMGASECALDKITAKGMKPILDNQEKDHISLRCPDCDMEKLPNICKPKSSGRLSNCPLFDKADPLGLDVAFQEVEAPTARPQTGKASGTSDKR
jgi:hypothetical protein